MDNVNDALQKRVKKEFFDIIKEDLKQTPPNTDHIKIVINELIDALCKFIPSKTEIHKTIKNEIYQEDVSFETMPYIINGLISWIEKFQCPADDVITKKWRKDFKTTQDHLEFIVVFLQEYYLHSEKVYKEVWEARKRVASGENAVPPEHRPIVKGSNGVPLNMKSGRK